MSEEENGEPEEVEEEAQRAENPTAPTPVIRPRALSPEDAARFLRTAMIKLSTIEVPAEDTESNPFGSIGPGESFGTVSYSPVLTTEESQALVKSIDRAVGSGDVASLNAAFGAVKVFTDSLKSVFFG